MASCQTVTVLSPGKESKKALSIVDGKKRRAKEFENDSELGATMKNVRTENVLNFSKTPQPDQSQ